MGSFKVTRTAAIEADPALIHALVNDFHEWPAWSPWEGRDADMERTYSGAESGVGAHYAWKGNRKAGEGSMEIVGSTPEQVDVVLSFLKPFKATNDVTFRIVPADGGADVAWEMTGVQTGLMAVFGKLMPMDRLVGKDFEKGLAQLKTVAEA